MPLSLVESTVAAIRAWLRARRPRRESIVIAATLALVFGAAYLAAFFIRSELLLQAADARTIVRTIGWVIACKLAIFYARGICHRPIRALRFEDLSSLVRATTTALLVFVAANFYFPKVFPDWIQIPRTVILLDWAFTLLAVGGMQAAARSIYEELMPVNPSGQRRTALFIDASEEGVAIVDALSSRNGGDYVVSGLLDDSADAYGVRVAGTRVIGACASAAPCAERLRVAEVIVRQGSLFGERLLQLCEECAAIRVRVGIAEREGAAVRVRGVELRDLIPRAEERFRRHDAEVDRWIAGRTVLVSGAGGTIGAEVCRQMLSSAPATIVLVERSEQLLAAIETELCELVAAGSWPGRAPRIEGVLTDVAKADRVDALLGEHRPSVVIHAAVLDQLPILEANPVEAIEGNLFATVTFAELCQRHGIASFVAVSSDKSVNPVSVMGATRLLGDRFLQALAAESATRFVVARIGNVLEAGGGAVPLFTRLLRERRPVTITDPGMARHFLTLHEAARLVLVAGAIGKSGEAFVPDIAPPMRIVDLVDALAFVERVSREDVSIRYGSPRPGEKLAEELFFGDEIRQPVAGSGLHRAVRPCRSLAEVNGWLAELRSAITAGGRERVVEILRGIVAEDAAHPPAPEAVAPGVGRREAVG